MRRRAIPRRTGRSRSPRRRACASAGRSPDLRESAQPCSAPADCEEIERAVELSRPELEVAGFDRWDEAIVEGLGEAECRVDPVPAEADRQLVRSQLARVVQPEDVYTREVRFEQLAVLGRVVFAEMPRVVRLLGPGRSEGQP